MTFRWRAVLLTALAIALLTAAPSRAQDYPNRTIRYIVPFGAGGPTDVFTRVDRRGIAQGAEPAIRAG